MLLQIHDRGCQIQECQERPRDRELLDRELPDRWQCHDWKRIVEEGPDLIGGQVRSLAQATPGQLAGLSPSLACPVRCHNHHVGRDI